MLEEHRGNYAEAKRRYVQALHINQALGHLHGLALNYMFLAELATTVKDAAAARGYFRQELEIDLHVGSPRWQTDTITKITELLVMEDEAEWAVELLTLIRQHSATVPPNHKEAEQRLVELQAELAPELFAAAVERGRARDLEASVKELIAAFSQTVENSAPQAVVQPLKDSLTERELDILRLIAEGRSNREIAEQLVLALGTVKWYISEIYGKLGVESRTQAIARARALNLLT
ncbi:MAG: response regulator transcription factor [Chloroflexota bacterium]